MAALRFFHAQRTPAQIGRWFFKLERVDRQTVLELLAKNPIIASVKDEAGLSAALDSDVPAVVKRVRESGKYALVHLDLVEGLASREVSVDFIAHGTVADGVLSTKAGLTRRAKELGLVSVQRFFLLDSMALENIQKHHAQDTSDLIEVLPGLMPKIIHQVMETVDKPVIAGGLIREKEDVTAALAAGAVAVSATSPDVWAM